jgi:sugar/nucleoside kinase (ribokinase family)
LDLTRTARALMRSLPGLYKVSGSMKTNKKLDCIVAGDVNVDLMVDGVIELEAGTERLANSMELTLGGSSGITAHNLSRLGAKVGFVGVTGNDVFGDFVVERLQAAGVDLQALKRHPSEKTGVTIWHSKDQQRAAVTYAGTLAMLRAKDIPEDYLRTARHLHIGHYFLLTALHKDAAKLFRKAKQLGLTTSVDCNYDPAETWASGLWELLEYTDVFIPNEDESRHLTGMASPADAAQELGKLAATVVVKMGAKGALVYSDGKSFHMPAVKTEAVDTTGAGDSFNAGFLSRFVRRASLRDCARAGASAGARCVTRVGGTTAFATTRGRKRR